MHSRAVRTLTQLTYMREDLLREIRPSIDGVSRFKDCVVQCECRPPGSDSESLPVARPSAPFYDSGQSSVLAGSVD